MKKEVTIKLVNVNKSFFGARALNNVNFIAWSGEVHTIVGQNGAGKSTLMKVLSGACIADTADIEVNGQRVVMHSTIDAEANGIGIVYQELSLMPHLSVAANIAITKEKTNRVGLIRTSGTNNEVMNVLASLGLNIDPRKRVKDLSASEQQIVEIAKVLYRKPRIIILDEPTAALNLKESKLLFAIVRKMRDQGLTIIFISHRLEEVFEISDRITVLRNGEVVLSSINEGLTEHDLVREMVGREVIDFFPRRAGTPSSDLILSVREISGPKFHKISFDLRKREIIGVSGLVGAGKSEIAHAIYEGQYVSGKIYKDGKLLKTKNPAESIRNGITLVTEDRKATGLAVNLSVRSNLSLPKIISLDSTITAKGFIKLFQEKNYCSKLINDYEIKTHSMDERVCNLSGGNQQKVAIVKWLSSRSDVFIFDDPTKGIDIGSKIEIYRIMNALADSGMGVILISSYIPELLALCDRIIVLSRGNVVAEYNKEEMQEDKVLLAQSL